MSNNKELIERLGIVLDGMKAGIDDWPIASRIWEYEKAATALEQADALNAQQAERIAELEASESQLISERDRAEEWGTKLADAIGEYFRVEVGEYSNMNDPREMALAIIEGEYITDSDADRQNAALAAQVVQMRAALLLMNMLFLGNKDAPPSHEVFAKSDAALALSTKPASEVLAEHDAKVIEPYKRSYDAALERLVIANKYIPNHLLDAFEREWADKKAERRALIAAPKYEPKES